MKIPTPAFFGLILLARAGYGAEILLHTGPTVSTPITSLESPEKTSEELVFLKQFFISSEAVEKLPASIDPLGSAALGAARAIELATTSDDLGNSRSLVVKKLEFLVSNTPKPVDFYLIEMLVNGSSEHRVVLMDGTVIKPRLKNVRK